MSYAIYKTRAIVLRLVPSGEANYDVVLFTWDFGKITVRAQSARKHESKMRMFLTRFRVVTVDLVRGKVLWRLTGISGEHASSVFSNEGFLQPLYRMFRLAEFLIQGESPHPELFDFFIGMLNLGTDAPQPPLKEGEPYQTLDEQAPSFRGGARRAGASGSDAEGMSRGGVGLELFCVIKMLDYLGYWQGETFPDVPAPEVLEACRGNRKDLVKKINESISATQIMVY